VAFWRAVCTLRLDRALRLHELVTVDDGLFLGQALLDSRGSLRRAAWFSLER
jgi:hypothetical protein